MRYVPISIPIVGGANTGTHPFALEPPELTNVVNARYAQRGALVKRRGYVTVASPSSKPERLMSYGRTLLAITPHASGLSNVSYELLALIDGDTEWIEQGLFDSPRAVCEATILDRIAVSRDPIKEQEHGDMEVADNCRVVVWQSRGPGGGFSVRGTVIDASAGAYSEGGIVNPEQQIDESASGAFLPRCAKVTGTLVRVVWAEGNIA